MEHRYCAEHRDIMLRPIHEDDIEHLRVWRNDEALSFYLREIPYITPEKQKEWYENYLNDSDTVFFGIVFGSNLLIGSVALYNFEDRCCEVGRIVIGDSSFRGKGYGYKSLILAMKIGIEQFNISEFHLDVHENNVAARKIYEKIGFQIVGKHPFSKGGYELEMSIPADEYYQRNPEANLIRVFAENNAE